MSRGVIATYGRRGHRRILVIRDAERGRVYCERYAGGRPIRKPTFPLTKEGERLAKLYAERWYTSGGKLGEKQLTLRDVWLAFHQARCTLPPEQGGLRPRTITLYKERWHRFMLFAKAETFADDVTLHTLDLFWNKLIAAGRAPNQVRNIVTAVKVVYRWAETRELISRNRPNLYKCPGGEKNKAREIPEYQPAELDRLLAHVTPQDGVRWRIAAALLFAAEHGFRSNAFLHLKWSDVDWNAGTVTMVEEYDKMHSRITRPLTYGALSALLTAKHWRERLGFAGEWVFFSGQRSRRDGPWTYQAANLALRAVEKSADVPHINGRAFHGVRRTRTGNVREETGDPVQAMFWIGDRDMKQATKYIKERGQEMQAIADREPTE